jgi:Zn-dependent M28 family amino/carboxypeptidase
VGRTGLCALGCLTLLLIVGCSADDTARLTDAGSAASTPGATDGPAPGGSVRAAGGASARAAAAATITAAEIKAQTKALSTDAMQGRAPGTPAEDLTLAYLERAFRELGVEPAAAEGFRQPVPMVEIAPDLDMQLTIGGRRLEFGRDFVAWTRRLAPRVELDDSELVFAGYGIVAPEYGWNDYEGIDWRGKTAVVLVNDPGYASGDPALFNGRAMTYYGRWTYKYEEAARQGAAALLIVHEDGPAGYGWSVVESSWSRPENDLAERDAVPRLAVEGWLSRESAAALFADAGRDLESLEAEALSGDFAPVPLGQRAAITIESTLREFTSNNVLATIPGSERPDEHILYIAHWDGLGVDSSLDGDTIYNGAADNATGVASLLEIAEAFASLPAPLARSVSFAAVTAEEKGLLGSQYFARHPIAPPGKIVAAFNMDIMERGDAGPTTTIIGLDNSELGELALAAAARQGRRAVPHPSPESGYFYRSDHFSLARVGVPSLLFLNPGAPDSEYVRSHYHQPSDEFDPGWSLEAAARDAQIFFDVGAGLAADDAWPRWSPQSEFRAIRQTSRED